MPPAAVSTPLRLDLIGTFQQAVAAAEVLLAEARRAVAERLGGEGRAKPHALDREQRAGHGLAWFATYVEAQSCRSAST